MAFISLKPVEKDSCESKSPLLFDVLSRINKNDFYEILDVGPATSTSIEYFNNYHCKIHICDCVTSLCEMTTVTQDTASKLNRAFAKALGLYKHQKNKIGIILLWDLPNYLQPEILSSLIQFLEQHTSKETIIHAYIHTARLMPASPGKYSIINKEHIMKYNNLDDHTDCPGYYQDTLHKHMYPFRVMRSVLQANGVQEYLFHRKGFNK